jgi:hypothetical protein
MNVIMFTTSLISIERGVNRVLYRRWFWRLSLTFSFLMTFTSIAFATWYEGRDYHIPPHGLQQYTPTHAASGPTQYVVNQEQTPSTNTVYGTINDQNHNNLSEEIKLPIGIQTPIVSGASKGKSICLMLESGLFDASTTIISFKWQP